MLERYLGLPVWAGEDGAGSGETPPGVTPPSPPSGETPPPPPPPEDWRDKRIATLTARNSQLRAALEADAAAKQKITGAPSPAIPDEAEISRRVEERANARAAEIAFAKECNDMILAGRKSFGEDKFNEKLDAFKKLQDSEDKDANARYWTLVRAVLDTGEGPKIIYDLGENLNEAGRLMNLSPTKLGIEISKRAAKLADAEPPEDDRARQISSAPPPISPVVGKSSHIRIEADDPERADRLSTEEWMARRNAQAEARWNAVHSRKRT